jgi:pyruvate,water dikinase
VPCLDDEQLVALLEMARRVERHFGSHQDVEWAIAREAEPSEALFVLQSRPVTAATGQGSTGRRSALDLVMEKFGASPGGAGR